MTRLIVEDTFIEGVKVVTRKPIGDKRGWFERLYCLETLKSVGWPDRLVQVNQSYSAEKGTLRGMHFQHAPHAEYKYVSCVNGRIYDVAVDLRQGSPTFLKHFGIELSEANHKSLVVPEGLAHGFQSLVDNITVVYAVSAAYNGEHEDGINPRDPALGIDWPAAISNMSEKDASKPFLDDSYRGISL